ncbi:unnamed protein product [Rotaria socialis]|uniref:Uncharacterized protein n=1 Tax=Rotaria socialis TaxID=392032 RepID=A0A818F3G3_9BILA|nr:unnamed protein product [Rotaria socialis]
MIGVPVNSNSVYVPMVQTGCLKAEFDSTYPIHLNGIISQHEFQESINKINAGMIFFIIGGIANVNSREYRFPVLIGVGIALTTFGSLFFAFGCCAVQWRRVARMRQAITEESMKYSSRSPIPCSWRLNISRTFVGGYGYYNNNHIIYHLVIDIGRAAFERSGMYQSNQVVPLPTSSIGGYYNYAAPPSYSAQLTGYCSHCSQPRPDLSAKFCSSCGNSFNIY